MDNIEQSTMFSKNVFIIIMLFSVIVLLSFFGLNILIILGNYIKDFTGYVGPFSNNILEKIGFGAGSALNFSSNLVAHTAIDGIEITNDVINDAGDLLKNESSHPKDEKKGEKKDEKKDEKKTLESFVEYAPYQMNEPEPSEGESIIQKSIGTTKNSWCLVGNNSGLNNCKNISAEDKCSSGNLYPSQFECLSKQF